MKQIIRKFALLAITLFITTVAFAQVTTSSVSGRVTEVGTGLSVPGAVIIAIHTPSGSKYYSSTDASGYYRIHNMRIGGPYQVEVSFLGYATRTFEGISLNLGENRVLNVKLEEESLSLDAVVVYAENDNTVGEQIGATTTISIAKMSSLPMIGRSIENVMKLTPQAYSSDQGPEIGGGTYRQNSFSVDGAAFNNAFGIGNSMPAGGSPISMDAIEQVSVSLTPFDVRQSGFLGASLSAVTRSGSNKFEGTAYSYFHNQDFRGNKVGDVVLSKNDEFDLMYGASVSGPIIKDKLLFFLNVEVESKIQPGPSAVASSPGAPYTDGSNNIARPDAPTLNKLSAYLKNKYGYETGPHQGYSAKSPAFKIFGRLDWNISNNHKLNIRYSLTKSGYPVMGPSISTGGLGDPQHVGKLRTDMNALSFQNTGYFAEENFSSIAAELYSSFGDGKFTNLLRATYSSQNNPRSTKGGYLPFVDIAEEGEYYTSFGNELFSYGNLRDVKTLLVTDEFSASLGRFNLVAGLQFEHNITKNGFQRMGAGYYQYDSLQDFYDGKPPHQFAITHSYKSDYSQAFPQFNFDQLSFYLQADAAITDNFKLTAGLRVEVPFYPNFKDNYNKQVGEAILKDIYNNGGKYSTNQLPKTSIMFSPRVGFNWDITGDRRFVLRGGTGLFTGRLPFVWIVAQAGDSGVIQNTYTAVAGDGNIIPTFGNDRNEILSQLYPNGITPNDPPNINRVTLMAPDLKMPQTWKSSLAFDFDIPGGFRATVEGVYNHDINPTTVENIALDLPIYSAVPDYNDNRLLWPDFLPDINGLSSGAFLLKNSENAGWYYSFTAKIEKTYWNGLSGMVAYTYSNAKSLSDGSGDQVFSLYEGAATIEGNGLGELGYANYVMPHRLIGSLSYRVEYARNFATSISLFYEGGPQSRRSYTYNTNVVGDGGGENLIYIPKTKDELKFGDYTPAGWDNVYTKEEQAEDFWNYINNDKTLKNRKGDYAERNGIIFPWTHQFDFQFKQDFYVTTKSGDRHTLQLGFDIMNIANLLNKNWGHKYYFPETEILRASERKVGFEPIYNFNTVGDSKLTPEFTTSTSFSSTWQMQLSIRYTF